MITVPVDLGTASYDVVVGHGARALLGDVLPAGVEKVAIVTQASIGIEVDPGVEVEVFAIPDGEAAKSLGTVESLCRGFALYGLARSDAVVALGGGVVTDVGGFAAATFHRGVAYVNIPTTLLGQVDAAIGGKTGVNLSEGKNLVGAFWQPSAVLCDTSTLVTLPPREWASGRGEIAKYALLEAAGHRCSDSRHPDSPSDPASASFLGLELEEQVARCVAIKARVVESDERENAGGRVVLNYGHTLAHALEAVALEDEAPFDIRHGEAVAIGLVFAAELAHRLGRIDEKSVAHHRRVVSFFDLPVDLPAGASSEALIRFMGRDKKAHHDLTFVLDGPEGIEAVPDVDVDDVMSTLRSMGAGA